MAKFRVTDPNSGKTLTLSSKDDTPPTEQELEQVFSQGLPKVDSQVTDTTSKKKSILPAIGQFAGGIGGGIAGATVGHPFVGSAVGGVVGRTGAREFERQTGELTKKVMGLKERPIETISETTRELSKDPFGVTSPFKSLMQRTPEERAELGKDIGITAAIETVAAPVAIGFNKVVHAVGKGISSGLLGRRVTERGLERGWKALLDPKLYQNRVPKEIAVKTDKFFNKISGVTGKRVSDLINTKYKNVQLNMTNIKNKISELLPKGGKPEDLLERFAPKSQKRIVKEITDNILQSGETKSMPQLWEMRKELDKAIFGKSWTQDALSYLKGIRRSLNEPIRNFSDDIASSFDNYAFVKDAEEELAKKFTSIQNKATGEIFTPDLEKFITSLLSESKDETIRLLKRLDTILDLPDRVMEKALDVAAAESLEKGVGITLVGRMVAGFFGGRKLIPRIGREIQRPAFQAVKTGVGRALPTSITEFFNMQR